MGVELPHPVINAHSLAYNFTNEGGVGGTFRLLKNIMGLWVLQECRRAWALEGHDHSYGELTSMAAGAEPFSAVLDPDAFLDPGHMPERIAAYCEQTGMFLPRALERRLPRILPAGGPGRAATALAIFLVVMSAAVAGGFALRDYSLGQIAAVYRLEEVILSPAPLTEPELDGAYRAAMEDAAVRAALDRAPAGKRLVYVIPEHWYLPDLPVESTPAAGSAPQGSAAFDRTRFKLLFANARSHDPGATGSDILKNAYGLDPIIVARVDAAAGRVTAVEQPPAHVRWGDIPTPTF